MDKLFIRLMFIVVCVGLFLSLTFNVKAVNNSNGKITYWKNYFSKEESRAVKKNAEKYVLSEIKKKSDDWRGVFTSFNLKKGSVNNNAVKDGGLGTDKIRGLEDALAAKLSTNGGTMSGIFNWADGQTFPANKLTGAYAALDGSQITNISASQINAVPYSGATGQVDLNGKNLINVGNIGIGTANPSNSLSIVAGSNKFSSPHNVYLMGDSLTSTSGHYGTQLSSLLGSDWNVIWRGISGNNTTQMLARFNTDIIVPGNVEYVIVWGGVNDIAGGVSSQTIENNLQSMYDMAHNAGIKVVAVNITPFSGDAGWASSGATARATQDAVNYWIANTARNVDYRVDAYSALVDPAVPYTLLPAYDDGGHLHLSSAGYAVAGTTIHDAVTWTPVLVDALAVTGGSTFSGSVGVSGTISGSNLSGNNTGDQSLDGLVPYAGATTNVNLGVHNLTVDTNSLIVDSTNHRVGIGVTSPTALFQVGNGLKFNSDYTMSWGVGGAQGRFTWESGKAEILGMSGNSLGLGANGSFDKLFIATNGKVGVGTTTPVAALDVNGEVKMKKESAQPFDCDATHDGTIALTSGYRTCVCNGGSTAWVFTADGTTTCTW